MKKKTYNPYKADTKELIKFRGIYDDKTKHNIQDEYVGMSSNLDSFRMRCLNSRHGQTIHEDYPRSDFYAGDAFVNNRAYSVGRDLYVEPITPGFLPKPIGSPWMTTDYHFPDLPILTDSWGDLGDDDWSDFDDDDDDDFTPYPRPPDRDDDYDLPPFPICAEQILAVSPAADSVPYSGYATVDDEYEMYSFETAEIEVAYTSPSTAGIRWDVSAKVRGGFEVLHFGRVNDPYVIAPDWRSVNYMRKTKKTTNEFACAQKIAGNLMFEITEGFRDGEIIDIAWKSTVLGTVISTGTFVFYVGSYEWDVSPNFTVHGETGAVSVLEGGLNGGIGYVNRDALVAALAFPLPEVTPWVQTGRNGYETFIGSYLRPSNNPSFFVCGRTIKNVTSAKMNITLQGDENMMYTVLAVWSGSSDLPPGHYRAGTMYVPEPYTYYGVAPIPGVELKGPLSVPWWKFNDPVKSYFKAERNLGTHLGGSVIPIDLPMMGLPSDTPYPTNAYAEQNINSYEILGSISILMMVDGGAVSPNPDWP